MALRYLVHVEKVPGSNYSAWVPDLPGCITTGATIDETLRNIKEAIEGHLEVMRDFGDPIPLPSTQDANALDANDQIGYVDVNVA